MPKRKLGSPSVSKTKTRKQSKSHDDTALNPFLPKNDPLVSTSEGDACEDDDLLVQTVAFLDLDKEISLLNESDGVSRLRLFESLKYILNFLEAEPQNYIDENRRGERMAAVARTATIILPWATKKLVGVVSSTADVIGQEYFFLWRALSAALLSLSSSADVRVQQNFDEMKHNVVEQALTSKVLLKLVPQAASVALKRDTASEYATKCYELLLLDNHFSLDIACKVLFSSVANTITEDENGMTTNTTSTVMLSTLRVIEDSRQRCNHKTIFQVFSTEETLLAFSRAYFFFLDLPEKGKDDMECIKLIRNILWESLFHPDHHMDGFRGIVQLRGIPALTTSTVVREPQEKEESKPNPSKQSSFHCYQESLLDLLLNLLLPDEAKQQGSEEREFSNANVISASRLLPLLLQGFLEMAREYDEANKRFAKRKTNSCRVDLAQMQLFFFATTASSLWGLVCRNVRVKNDMVYHRCLQSLSECSSLLLQHDAFVSSNDQKHLTRFSFLEALTTGILEKTWSDSIASGHVSSIIEALTSLEHRLVRDRLEAVVSFSAEQHIIEETNTNVSPATKLLLSVIDSYQKLRQINLLFCAILKVITTSRQDKNKEGLSALRSLLSQPSVQQALAECTKDSPIREVQEMFSTLDDWVVQASLTKSHTEDPNWALALVIEHIGTGLLGSVRVDKNSAPSVATCCRQLMKNSVPALCGEGDDEPASNPHRIKLGVTLCAWILNLQMKCAFWLGFQHVQQSENEVPLPWSIRNLLSTCVTRGSNSQPSDQGTRELIDGLTLLASFRLRQLDYFVHDQSFEDSEGLSLREEYRQEAISLAGLMAEWADDSAVVTSRWHYIARVITSWVPYASKEQHKLFLRWIFSTISDAVVNQKDIVLVYPGGRKLPHCVYNEERAVAFSLLKDASFPELKELSDLFSSCALSTAALLIREAFNLSPQMVTSPCRELCPVWADDFTSSTPLQFLDSLKWKGYLPQGNTNLPDTALKLLEGAARVVKSLNGLPPSSNPQDSVDCADSALRLEAYCRKVQAKSENSIVILQDLTSALRMAAAKQLTLSKNSSLTLLPNTSSAVKASLNNIKGTSLNVLEEKGIEWNPQSRQFLFTTEELVGAVIGCYHQSNSNDAIYSYMMESFGGKKQVSDTESMILLVLHRSILRSLCNYEKLPFREGESKELVSVLLNWALSLSKRKSFKTSAMLQSYGCLFIGEACILLSKANGDESVPKVLAATIEELGGTFIPEALSEKRGTLVGVTAGLYMVSCYSLIRPPDKIRQLLIDNLLQIVCESPWLEVSICSLAREMHGDSLRATMLKISGEVQKSLLLSLRLFQVLLRELKNVQQTQIIANFGEGIFHKALLAIDCHSEPEIAVTALSVIAELSKEKLLISLRERDLAAILASATRALERKTSSSDIHSSCYFLVAALLQRFPKQLYLCAPSVIAVLQAFLRLVLRDELDGTKIRDRSQQFTRLCELLLPHKEVYKKHVLSMLLEFVYCLEHNLSLFQKENLMLSVFYLLDMLSKYEMQQLNTLMNTTAKTLFRGVYQNYQKVHAYKG